MKLIYLVCFSSFLTTTHAMKTEKTTINQECLNKSFTVLVKSSKWKDIPNDKGLGIILKEFQEAGPKIFLEDESLVQKATTLFDTLMESGDIQRAKQEYLTARKLYEKLLLHSTEQEMQKLHLDLQVFKDLSETSTDQEVNNEESIKATKSFIKLTGLLRAKVFEALQ